MQLALPPCAAPPAADLDSARADWRVRDIGAAGGAVAATRTCDNCGRSGIPTANYEMHAAICQRQNWRCETCEHVMPAAEKQAHLDAVLSVDAAFAAATEDGVEVLRTFLAHGGDKDALNSFSDRLIHVAVRSGKTAVTRVLLEYKADTSLTNAMLDNPLQIAMKHNHKDLLLLLMKHNKKLKKERAKNSGQATRGNALPLRDVTNIAKGNGPDHGAVAPPMLSDTVKICGPGQDICGNCGEAVPSANLALHELRCQRQNFRCPHCSEMVPASERAAHLDTSDELIFAAANAGEVSRLEILALHGADIPAARQNGNSVLHAAVSRRDVALVIWLVEELKMNPADKNALNDSAIDLALRVHNEEMLLFLTLALSEADTGSETTAAIQAQLPGGCGATMLGQPKITEQERVLERMFQMDEVRCMQASAAQPNRRLPQRGLPSRFQQLAHMSPIIVRTRSGGPLDSPDSASGDSSQDQSVDQSSCCLEAGSREDCDNSTSQMLDFDGEDGQDEGSEDAGVEMAGFTVKGSAMQVGPDHAGRVCDSPQLPVRQPSPSMSPITVGCLPEFMPSPLDLLDKPGGAVREKSPLEVVRRDITAAGSNLGAQLAECVARFDANEAEDAAYDSDDLEQCDLTIAEGDEEGSELEADAVLGRCGKGLMTMGFQVPLGGGDGEEGDSCLEVFFGYVRRGISNEVLRAVRRWALDGSERDGDGNTAVHIAAIHGNTNIVELLVKEGFDCSSRNREGQTPADCAQVVLFSSLCYTRLGLARAQAYSCAACAHARTPPQTRRVCMHLEFSVSLRGERR